MIWLAIVIGAVVIFGIIGYRRNTIVPLRRLTSFLRNRGVEFVRIRKGIASYGWPSYVVVFDSEEESAAFQKSSACDALTQEVRGMHKNLDGFKAERAVSVDPIVRSSAVL